MNLIPVTTQKVYEMITILEACVNCKHAKQEYNAENSNLDNFYSCYKYPNWDDPEYVDENGLIKDHYKFQCGKYELVERK